MSKANSCRIMAVVLGFLIQLPNSQALAAEPARCRVAALDSKTVTLASIDNATCRALVKVTFNEDRDKSTFSLLKIGTLIAVPQADEVPGSSLAPLVASAEIWQIGAAILAGLAAAFTYACCIAGGRTRLIYLVVGADERYSNSKVQTTAWMGVLMIAYIGTGLMRLWHGMEWTTAFSVGISDNLLATASLSVGAAAGAKITTGAKVATSPDTAKPKGRADQRSLLALFRNDSDEWDIGDAQMILITLGSIIYFIFRVSALWSALPLAAKIDLPEPTNIVTLVFGSSLGGYLAKKIASAPGAG
jgi:hypothetical protein